MIRKILTKLGVLSEPLLPNIPAGTPLTSVQKRYFDRILELCKEHKVEWFEITPADTAKLWMGHLVTKGWICRFRSLEVLAVHRRNCQPYRQVCVRRARDKVSLIEIPLWNSEDDQQIESHIWESSAAKKLFDQYEPA